MNAPHPRLSVRRTVACVAAVSLVEESTTDKADCGL